MTAWCLARSSRTFSISARLAPGQMPNSAPCSGGDTGPPSPMAWRLASLASRAMGERRVRCDPEVRDVLAVPDPREDAASLAVAVRCAGHQHRNPRRLRGGGGDGGPANRPETEGVTSNGTNTPNCPSPAWLMLCVDPGHQGSRERARAPSSHLHLPWTRFRAYPVGMCGERARKRITGSSGVMR
jgi:hypothetical protein